MSFFYNCKRVILAALHRPAILKRVTPGNPFVTIKIFINLMNVLQIPNNPFKLTISYAQFYSSNHDCILSLTRLSDPKATKHFLLKRCAPPPSPTAEHPICCPWKMFTDDDVLHDKLGFDITRALLPLRDSFRDEVSQSRNRHGGRNRHFPRVALKLRRNIYS